MKTGKLYKFLSKVNSSRGYVYLWESISHTKIIGKIFHEDHIMALGTVKADKYQFFFHKVLHQGKVGLITPNDLSFFEEVKI
jgi:hypothetical protein